ncbi:MAG: YgeY family selenium metabolism-linked hydrolase [Candidatus Heimdallarchaeota archaeon]|nr:MAG: YgeY family selenium metabolism-linked hydrolase [Candidatus Heimdallarchaeota archaeon]
MKDQIEDIATDLEQEVIDFTREIISIPSVTGNEGPVIKRIQKEMKKIGYKSIQIDDMGNLVGRIGSGENLIAIDGHVDTVEIGEKTSWKHDPFDGKLEDDIIYGRGACDQKGGVASVLYAGKILKEIGVPEKTTLLVVCSVQEEIYEGLNWQYIITENKVIPDAVILSEPSNLNIAIGHRGRVDIKVRTTGISSHGAAPELGDNAIYKIAPIVLDIIRMDSELNVDPIFGKGNVCVTDIRSTSPSINATADSSTIHIDRRLTSKDSEESVLNEIKALESVKRTNAEVYIPEHKYQSKSGSIYSVKGYYPSWYMEESHPLVQTASRAYEIQFNKDPVLNYWRFSTNGAATKGIFNIPTIGFGPGNEKFAHTIEDQVPVEHLVKAMAFYTQFVRLWGRGN